MESPRSGLRSGMNKTQSIENLHCGHIGLFLSFFYWTDFCQEGCAPREHLSVLEQQSCRPLFNFILNLNSILNHQFWELSLKL